MALAVLTLVSSKLLFPIVFSAALKSELFMGHPLQPRSFGGEGLLSEWLLPDEVVVVVVVVVRLLVVVVSVSHGCLFAVWPK